MGTNSPEYQAEYRARNPDYVNVQRERAQARSAALKRLREAHPGDYLAFLSAELQKRGLEP